MTAALEEIKSIDIEEWLTLATAPSSTKLKLGQSPAMENVWVDEKPGSVITSPGFTKVGQIPSNNPVSFCINFFRTTAGTQTFVVSDNATVWTTVDFQNFTSIITGLASAFQLRGKVIRDKLWLTNGSDAVRVFDGTTTVVMDGTNGTPTIPRGRFIDYYDERVWLYHISNARSQAAFSALTDNSGTIIAPDNASAWPTSNTLQVSEGDADFGTGLLLYRGYLHFFKQYSIWRLVGYDEYTYTRVKTRASTGCRFNESIQILDSLVHFIGIDGIYVFDGEESQRISDIIDPATASQTAFGFNQLQQPNVNNQFWGVSTTTDWNAGTVPTNIVVNDQLALVATDDSQADFQAGVVQTNLDLVSNPGFLQLAHSTSGASSENIALNKSVIITPGTGGGVIGNPASLTDGSFANLVGFSPGSTNGTIKVSGLTAFPVSQIILKSYDCSSGSLIFFSNDSGTMIPLSTSLGGILISGGILLTAVIQTDITITFSSPVTTTTITFSGHASSSPPGNILMTEIQIYPTAYNATGTFTSKALDLTQAPFTPGNLNVSMSLNGQIATFFTQSSADGVTWEAPVVYNAGTLIGSTMQRYLRWVVNFNSDGSTTPVIDAVYLQSVYISAIHNTGGNIFSWGPFESVSLLAGKTIFYYYRTATTSGGIPAASWRLIVPGGVLSDPVANQFVQFRIDIQSGEAGFLPIVPSVTINWVEGTAGQQQTLQNVASFVWRNRYYLSAAGPGATSNNTVLVRGKKTFGSPWMLKDWDILSFTRYQDSFYGGWSGDGSIVKLDTGYSRNGNPMDSYFETGDFLFAGFYINPKEILVEVERKGSYSMSIGFSIDRGNTWMDLPVDLTVSTFAQSYIKKLNMDTVNTDRIRFRARTNAVDQPFEVHRLIFYYTLESARGSIK